MNNQQPEEQIARQIQKAFESFQDKFKEITSRAKLRFENRDWQGMQKDAAERLDLYKKVVDETVSEIKNGLKGSPKRKSPWPEIKKNYSNLIQTRNDIELAETFYNSVSRRVAGTVGVNPDSEYTFSPPSKLPEKKPNSMVKDYEKRASAEALIRQILTDMPFNKFYQNLGWDARLVAAALEIELELVWKGPGFERIELLTPVFYRRKGAYLVGKIMKGSQAVPFVLCFLHKEKGVFVDAALFDPDEVSIVFSFTRSYFHAEMENPKELIAFLKSVMPLKPTAELYIAVGYNRHGKTELFRDFISHLESANEKFEVAKGERGMVMMVFALPSYEVVFKVIKDAFDYPKTATREKVMEKYRMVFKHDRAGRLVDAMEFEHLEFKKGHFKPELLEELLRVASKSVEVTGGRVIFKHLYTERKVVPLNLYLKEAEDEKIREAVIDYGNTIKDLAATNIFPGDILLKNFGMTRTLRVVFYDYDELCLLTDCSIREIPKTSETDDELQPEPWYYVRENEIFPEEFETFLGLEPRLKEVFLKEHRDLLSLGFWKKMQERILSGELADIFPYKQHRRLKRPI